MVGLAVMAAGLFCLPLMPSYGWFFVLGPVIAFGNGLAFPTFTSLFSQACRAEEAGELLGQSNAMGTFGRVIGAWVGGLLMAGVSAASPFVFGGALMAGGMVVFIAARHTLLGRTAEG